MKITILSENNSYVSDLEPEFGLSVLLEKGGLKLLFDCGTNNAFMNNAKKLGIRLDDLSVIAFSHNHRDHCGGFIPLAREIRPVCPIYAHRGFFTRKWWDHRFDPVQQPTFAKNLELVGPPMSAEFFFQNGIDTFRIIDDDLYELGENVYLVGNFPENCPGEEIHPSSVMELPNGNFTLDTFRDEQVCVIRSSNGLVILTGCAHNGIINIIETIKEHFQGEKVVAVFGGTHLVPPDDSRIERTIRYFSESGIKYSGVCHCTGSVGMARIEESVSSFLRIGAGYSWEYEN